MTTKISKTCQGLFALSLAFFAIRLLLYHLYLIIFPYPAMLREGALMTSTQALLNGLNPYAMGLQPQYTNVYGILYPLLVFPLAKLFGATLLVHRIVTAFFILAICALVFLVLKKMQVPVLLNAWAVLMLYAALLYPATSTPCVDSGSLGMFFLLLTIFIPWFDQYSNRSLIVSLLCGILGFYAKQYSLLGVVVMGSYLFLFVSRSKSIYYLLSALLSAIVSVIIVDRIFPAYFDNCFFVSYNMGPAWSTMERLYMQVHMYTGLHLWVLILAALYIWRSAYKFFRHNPLNTIPSIIVKNLRHFPLVLYAGLWSSLVLYTSLGRHNGATLWYFFQLLSPFLLIALAWLFSTHKLWPILCTPLLVYNLYIFALGEGYKVFDQNMEGWPQVTQIIGQHEHILNSSLIAPLLIEQNKDVVDNGMSEYFGSGAERTSWTKNFFQDDYRVYMQLAMYFGNIRGMVENKGYDMIILQPGLLPLGVGDDIKKFYKFEGEANLYAPQDRRNYAVTFWVPS